MTARAKASRNGDCQVAGVVCAFLLHLESSALEMINWMRNHASPAHDSDTIVTNEDVIAHALILQKNLFEDGLPDPGHSPAGL